MYLKFKFEGEVHELLDCVPLTVRRKLDLAALKISLAGWQALGRDERLALCHLPVDAAEDLAVYREVLQGFCARAGVPLKPLEDPDAASRSWTSVAPPEPLAQRLAELGVALEPSRWRALDEEARYALVKLSAPKRPPEKLRAACIELGLLAGESSPINPEAVVCGPVK